jgi:hypothetical protein
MLTQRAWGKVHSVEYYQVTGCGLRGTGFGFRGVSAAAGLKSGQFDRKRNFGLAGSQTCIKNEHPPAMHSALS